MILSNKSPSSISAGSGVAGVSSQGRVLVGKACVLVEPGDIKELYSVVTSMLPTDSGEVGIFSLVPATATSAKVNLLGVVDAESSLRASQFLLLSGLVATTVTCGCVTDLDSIIEFSVTGSSMELAQVDCAKYGGGPPAMGFCGVSVSVTKGFADMIESLHREEAGTGFLASKLVSRGLITRVLAAGLATAGMELANASNVVEVTGVDTHLETAKVLTGGTGLIITGSTLDENGEGVCSVQGFFAEL